MILYLASDLLWASRIKATADAVGVPARPVRNLEMLEARLTDSPVKALLLDLEAPEAALAMLGRLRGPSTGAERSVYTLAFGPHVATELFAKAKAAGADAVVPRGAVANRLEVILKELDARPGLAVSGPA